MVNYATKYQHKVAERFKLASITDAAAGDEYSFVGAKTIKVTSVNTVPLSEFNRDAASNRFGAIANLGDTVQEMQMTKDLGFGFSIDAGDNSDRAIDESAGRALRREIDEEVIPTKDQYRLEKWAAGAGQVVYSGSDEELTAETILAAVMTVNGALSNKKVPKNGRRLFMPVRNIIKLMQAKAILNLESTGTKVIGEGAIGKVAGCILVEVPDDMFPAGCEFMIKHKSASVDPVKLQNYYIRKDAQGFDGPVVEGRIYFDAFVLEAKKDGIGVYKIGAGA